MDIIVVGGSLGGLFAGVSLRRTNQGHRIRILERSPIELHNLGAGVVMGADTSDFFDRFDKSRRPMTVDSPLRQYLDLQGGQLSQDKWKQKMTSWDLLYNVLRWNYDGRCEEGYIDTSSIGADQDVTNGESKGSVTYSLGCKVTSIKEVKTDAGKAMMEVTYTDDTGATQTTRADLVVGADGPGSTVRELMDAKATREYAGYVVWRGTLLEDTVSTHTRETMVEKFTFFHGPGIQILSYIIPGAKGTLERGKRLLNWAWYNNYPEGSAEYTELMTDTDGKMHRITLPQGKMNPDVWKRQKEYAQRVLPPQCAEMVCNTEEAFIQVVTDSIAGKSAYFDGKVLLVGDALAGLRPHTASSTSQAAYDCNLMHDMLLGKVSLDEWEKNTMEYATVIQAKGVEMGTKSQFSDHPMACAPDGRWVMNDHRGANSTQ